MGLMAFHPFIHIHRCMLTLWLSPPPNLKLSIVDILGMKLRLRKWVTIPCLSVNLIILQFIYVKRAFKSYIHIYFCEMLCKIIHLKFNENFCFLFFYI